MIKVMMVHNHYQQYGGEDKVVEQESQLLRSRGLEVELYAVHNDKIKEAGATSKVKTAIDAVWSYTEYRNVTKKLQEFRPDVVHVHNFFPLISPSVYYACDRMNIPVVQTLHNYRLVCPAATFLLGNDICEKCLQGSLVHSVVNSCYRDSRIQTIPIVSMIVLNNWFGTWKNKVSRYIALTEFAKKKFVQAGLPEGKITIKPNFLSKAKRDNERITIDQKYILFVGRLSAEKGIENLMKAWLNIPNREDVKLFIIGDGPEKDRVSHLYQSDSIHFLGKRTSEEVLNYMSNALYLITPSIWYEGLPMTIVEAFSVGTPVLCSKIGSMEEIVEDGVTGFHFVHNDIEDMARTIKKALEIKDYQEIREAVYKDFHLKYTEATNYEMLTKIYNAVIEEKRGYAKI